MQVLLELAKAGIASRQLDELVAAAGDAAGRDGARLLTLLAPGDAGRLLVTVEQVLEEGAAALDD